MSISSLRRRITKAERQLRKMLTGFAEVIVCDQYYGLPPTYKGPKHVAILERVANPGGGDRYIVEERPGPDPNPVKAGVCHQFFIVVVAPPPREDTPPYRLLSQISASSEGEHVESES